MNPVSKLENSQRPLILKVIQYTHIHFSNIVIASPRRGRGDPEGQEKTGLPQTLRILAMTTSRSLQFVLNCSSFTLHKAGFSTMNCLAFSWIFKCVGCIKLLIKNNFEKVFLQNKLSSVFFLLIFISFLSPLWADIKVENPWVRSSLGPNAALFMTLINTSTKPERLTQAQLGKCAYTELHTHKEEEGVFRMIKVDFIEIPSLSQKDLKPGGHHIMLIKIHAPLKDGDEVPVVLSFESGKTLQFTAPVKGIEGECCQPLF